MDKVRKVMREFKEGELHSGSKKGPVVQSRKQAVAIALNESRDAKTNALKKRINPVAENAANLRKRYGDVVFPAIADKMIEGVKRRRESRENDKAMGY